MPTAAQARRIDEVMERAAEALKRRAPFEAERLAIKALAMAREEREFERMARIIVPLQQARRQRVQLAFDAKTIFVIDQPITEDMRIAPGCHLVRPPNVGIEARRLRLSALLNDTPVVVVCREPKTQLGLWPIVAIAPGATMRTKVKPPRNQDRPDADWFAAALDALGEVALETVDAATDPDRRVDALLARLDAVPEHEPLHQALAETCLEAHRAQQDGKPARSARNRDANEDESNDA